MEGKRGLAIWTFKSGVVGGGVDYDFKPQPLIEVDGDLHIVCGKGDLIEVHSSPPASEF